MASGPINYTCFWITILHISLDLRIPHTLGLQSDPDIWTKKDSWTNRLHLHLDHYTSHTFVFIDSTDFKTHGCLCILSTLLFLCCCDLYNWHLLHVCLSWKKDPPSAVLPEVSYFCCLGFFKFFLTRFDDG